MEDRAELFEQLLQKVASNDSECTSVSFWNDPDGDNDALAAALGDALIRNTTVDHLMISVHQLTTAAESLLHWIGASPSLVSITVDGRGDFTLPTASPIVVAHFLRAIQTSVSIQKLELTGCYLVDSAAFAYFLRRTRSVVELEMDCAVFAANDARGAERVAQAFRDNGTLQYLYLEITEDTQPSVTEIVSHLGGNETLRHLALEWSPPEQRNVDATVTNAIGTLLRTSQTLHKLELQCFDFRRATGSDTSNPFDPMARGLESSQTLQELNLQLCRLDISACTRLEKAMMGSAILTLVLSHSHLGSAGETHELILSVLAKILEQANNLTHIRLDSPHLPDIDADRFVKALVQSPALKRLSLDCLNNEFLFRELMRLLPSAVHLHTLRFVLSFPNLNTDESRKKQLTTALNQNSSLVGTEILPEAFLPRSRSLLDSYARRNRRLRAWRSVKPSRKRSYLRALPSILKEATPCKHGPMWIWATLLALGDAIGPDLSPATTESLKKIERKGATPV